MTWKTLGLRISTIATAGLAFSASLAAADPPDRVARLSFVSGPVSFRPSSVDEWTDATVNYPLTIGDHLWTDRGSRTELQLGPAVLRLGPYSELSILNLDDSVAQIRLTQGTMSIRVRRLDPDDVIEIDTPNGAVSLLRPGLYRLDVADTGDSTTVTARQGEAEITTVSQVVDLPPGQSVLLSGIDAPQADVRRAVGIDDFEDWCLTRDRRIANLPAGRYVSPDLIGYEDLDAAGTWDSSNDYGSVWIPRVSPEWVPYRYGRWAWVEPWGWTWIDDAPWGFAPFHYGRWVWLPARGWGWTPGAIEPRPVYAPALVAFVGGSGWSASIAIGGAPVAWFPLGPREVYVPSYRTTPVYVQRINVTQVTNINVTNINVTNINYVNQSVAGAVTAVPRDTFVRARPVAAAAIAVSRAQLQNAAVVGTAPSLAPQRESVVGERERKSPAPPVVVANRQVVVRRTPAPTPLSLAVKQNVLDQQPGKPVDEKTERELRGRARQGPQGPQGDFHPLVRTTTPSNASGAQAGPATAAQPRVLPAPPPAPGPAPPSPPNAPPFKPQGAPAQQAGPAQTVDLAAQHARERASLDARHAQERQAMLDRHLRDEKAAKDDNQRSKLQKQHAQEVKALQDRQNHERENTQARQEDERRRGRKD